MSSENTMSSRSGFVAVPPSEASDFSQSQVATGSSRIVMTSEPPTPPEEFEEQKNTWFRNHYLTMSAALDANAGLLLIIGSQAFFSMMNVAVKILNSIDPPVPTLELITVRMLITYVFSLIYMLVTKVPDPWLGPKGIRFLLVFRGFSGEISPSNFVINEYDLFFAQDLGKVTPEQRLVAVGVAMLGVLGATGAYISITAMGKRAHPLHAMMSFSSQSVIAAVIGMLVQKTPIVIPTKIEWVAMLIMIGVFGFIAQTLLTMGLQRETAGRGSIAIYTQIVFASILERIFFEAESSFLSLTGTFIIIVSALYVGFSKQRARTAKTKSNVRLSGVLESDLEEGLLDGLLEAHANEHGKTGPVEFARKPSRKANDHERLTGKP
ncbi:hypothetical protein C0993_009515 [Termitomyces sp. T159_Od127]|nr:hypothetical protein C0993_009515 [Termitomyces sp. T159_Od127]